MREIGRIVEIYTSPQKGAPMQKRDSVLAIAGKGLEGDRYAQGRGAYSGVRIPDADRQVTLISSEGIVRANKTLQDQGVLGFETHETRRNIIVSADPDDLNNLVGKTFILGGVEMEGSELCDPCRRPSALRKTSDGKAFEEAFTGRGGLRARIVSDGELKPGGILGALEQ